jgi:hypothetical protein
MSLHLDRVCRLAEKEGYEEIYFRGNHQVIDFIDCRHDDHVILRVYLKTGIVSTSLFHPKQGRRWTLLFRYNVQEDLLVEIFHDPRVHTGTGATLVSIYKQTNRRQQEHQHQRRSPSPRHDNSHHPCERRRLDDENHRESFYNSIDTTCITCSSNFTPGDRVHGKGRAVGDAMVLSYLLGNGSNYSGTIKIGYDKSGSTYHMSPYKLVLIIADECSNKEKENNDEFFCSQGESYNNTDMISRTSIFFLLQETAYMLKSMAMQLRYRTCWEVVHNIQEESRLDMTRVVVPITIHRTN